MKARELKKLLLSKLLPLRQKDVTGELIVEAFPQTGAVWDVSNRPARQLGKVYGEQGLVVAQEAGTGRLVIVPLGSQQLTLAQEAVSGRLVPKPVGNQNVAFAQESDGRSKTTISNKADVVSNYSGVSGTVWTPAAGKKIRLAFISVAVDAAARVYCTLTIGAVAKNVFDAQYVAKGTVLANFINCNPEGDVNTTLTVTTSAGTVYVVAMGTET